MMIMMMKNTDPKILHIFFFYLFFNFQNYFYLFLNFFTTYEFIINFFYEKLYLLLK
jgi:hypothetical protein